MRAPRVRYRIRLRFTVRRLIASMACFGLAFGVMHDATYVNEEAGEIPWASWAAIVLLGLPVAAMGLLALLNIAAIVMRIVITNNVIERVSSSPTSGMAVEPNGVGPGVEK
jgi:hypothetical protein